MLIFFSEVNSAKFHVKPKYPGQGIKIKIKCDIWSFVRMKIRNKNLCTYLILFLFVEILVDLGWVQWKRMVGLYYINVQYERKRLVFRFKWYPEHNFFHLAWFFFFFLSKLTKNDKKSWENLALRTLAEFVMERNFHENWEKIRSSC